MNHYSRLEVGESEGRGAKKSRGAKKRPPERSRSQGGGEPEPFPGAIGRTLPGVFAQSRGPLPCCRFSL